MIKILELFGGIGAPRKALINLGIPHKSIDYVEIDEKAVRTYNAIFKDKLKYTAQSVIDWNLKPDILIHGSPCQDFSIAGRQKGTDPNAETRSSLMWETIKIIKNMGIWKPRVVIWENVKNEMEELGYTNSYETLNAMDFGIPQKRERVFTVSLLGIEKFDFSKLEKIDMKSIHEFLEEDSDISDLYTVKAPSMVDAIGKSNTIRRSPIIENYCYTITERQDRTPNAGVINIGNDNYRYLTEKECWLLMGFENEDFEKALKEHPPKKGCMNRTLYKQAGNSIVVPILEGIFKEVLLQNIIYKNKGD